MHEVPFLTIKDISNNELLAATDLATFGDFHRAEIGKRAAALTVRTIARLWTTVRGSASSPNTRLPGLEEGWRAAPG
jgi:hypothetical protein